MNYSNMNMNDFHYISFKKDCKIKSVTILDLRIIKSIEDTRERVLLPLLFRCLWISVTVGRD